MGRDSVELVRRAYLAWQEGDLEELISLLDPQVTWSPVLRFLEGRRTAVGRRCADGFGGSGSPVAASSRCHSTSRTTASGCWASAIRPLQRRDDLRRWLLLTRAKRSPRLLAALAGTLSIGAKACAGAREQVFAGSGIGVGATTQRCLRKKSRRSLVSRSGVSMAGKCPPRSNCDQCSIVPAGSMTLLMVVSAANTATPLGGPAWWSPAVPGASGWEAAI